MMMAGLHMLLSDLQQSHHSPRRCSAGLVEKPSWESSDLTEGSIFLLDVKYLDSVLILEMTMESPLICDFYSEIVNLCSILKHG